MQSEMKRPNAKGLALALELVAKPNKHDLFTIVDLSRSLPNNCLIAHIYADMASNTERDIKALSQESNAGLPWGSLARRDVWQSDATNLIYSIWWTLLVRSCRCQPLCVLNPFVTQIVERWTAVDIDSSGNDHLWRKGDLIECQLHLQFEKATEWEDVQECKEVLNEQVDAVRSLQRLIREKLKLTDKDVHPLELSYSLLLAVEWHDDPIAQDELFIDIARCLSF